MNSVPAAAQPFAQLFDNPPSSRQQAPAAGLGASIWAPQPQPSDNTWSKAIDSFSRVQEHGDGLMRPEYRRATSHPGGNNSEDVFGPVGVLGHFGRKPVGTIGDGRRKTPPDFDPMVSPPCRVFTAYMRANRRFSMCISSFALST